MRLLRPGTGVLLALLVAASASSGERSLARDRDRNRANRGQVPQVAEENAVADAVDDEIGISAAAGVALVSMPAPSTEVAIDVTVKNTSSASPVGARDIQAVIIDCARALGKKGLTMDAVFNVVGPAGGTATVTTGNDADDVGPAILTFTGFNDGETVSFSLDPDTWDDPSFGATRANLAGCRVEVVFFGAESLRGDGVMKKKFNDTVVAKVVQRFPAP
jgi:hypothetical protein